MTQEHFEDTLGCGPAPHGPVPPRTQPAAQPAAGAAQPAAQPVVQPAAPRPRVRRVGTFTMGVALILAGLLICASLLLPGFNILLAAKLAPLVLVALGCEVLYWSAHQGSAKIKYDFLSMFVCFVLLCGSIGAAAVPALWRYFGPDRQMTESRLANELVEAAYPALKDQNLRNMSVNVSLTGVEFDAGMALTDLTAQDYVGVNVTLRGAFADTQSFAAACRRVLDVLGGLGVPLRYVDFYAEDETNHYTLSVSSRYDWDASAAQLAELASHEVYTENEDWMEEQNFQLQQAYEDGWYLAAQSGPDEPVPEWSEDAALQRAFEMGWSYGCRLRDGYARTEEGEGEPEGEAFAAPAGETVEPGSAVQPVPETPDAAA